MSVFEAAKVQISVRLCAWHPRIALVFVYLAVLMPLPSPAHHSYAVYDATQTRTLNGTVETFQWINPHTEFTLLLRSDGGGESSKWNIESSSPSILMHFGWTRDSIKPGDRVRVLCDPLSDGANGCRLHTLTLLDTGQVLQTKLSAGAQSPIK
jgi:hypothetical protein